LRIKFLLIFIILIVGCSLKSPQKDYFKDEDKFLIKAVVLEQDGNYKAALNIYKFLYEKTKKSEYYAKYLEMLLDLRKFSEVVKKADKFLSKNWSDEVFKLKIYALLNLNRLEEARKELLTKFNKKNEFFYSMMSYILMKKAKFEEALIYSKSNYALNPTVNNLVNLADNLIKLKKYNEALAYLQTYLKENGCNYRVCLKLAEIYKTLYETDNLANIYEKLGIYDRKFYILALNLYLENREFKKAENLIKKYNLGDEYLLFVYEGEKEYKKAALLSLYLYTKTEDIKYLIKYTEYCYEACKDKESVKDIANKLKFILKRVKNAYLYNFLGYILIDNDIDVKKGIKYIQKALELAPDKIEYIDSLAWGYYKLGKCKEAWEIINSIDSKDEEILKHKKLIKRCLDDFRENNSKNKRGFSKKKK